MQNEQIKTSLHHEMPVEKPWYQYEIMKDSEQRMLLAKSVDRLLDDTNRIIGAHTEGNDRMEKEDIPSIVFLDKSARPVSTLFLDLWKKKFPEYPSPDVRFMNVGKETAERFKSFFGDSYTKLPPPWEPNFNEEYQKLKATIENISPEKIKTEMLTEQEIELLKKIGEGKKELVLVEEYTETGESLLWAKKLLMSVNPDVAVSSRSLATHKDKLFEIAKGGGGRSGLHNPPWRKVETDAEYGITGVIDSPSLSAEPWYNREDGGRVADEVKERLGVLKSKQETDIHEFIKYLYGAWGEENGQKLIVRLEDFRTNLEKLSLKDTDDQKNKDILKQVADKMIVSANVVHEIVKDAIARPETDNARVLSEATRSFVGTIKSARMELNKIDSVSDEGFYEILMTSRSFFREIETNFGGREYLQEIDTNEREIEELSRGANIAQSMRGLRNEMHAIADEYWQNKEAGNSQ